MKQKENLYLYYQNLVKNKDKSVEYFIENTLNKTQSMFIYQNLPETIPQSELENILQRFGVGIFTKVEDKFYILSGSLGGELNAYYKPTKFIVANPFLNLSKEYDIEDNKDGVLVKNDYNCQGLLPIIGKYAVLLTDCGISLNTAAVLTRLTMLISASDDKTKQSADLFIEKILNGDFSVIGENAFLNGVKLQQINNTNVKLTDIIELMQYYKSNLLAEIGLNSNFNMKRERLNESEILLNNDDLLPFVENMLTERKKAVDKINEKYDLNITVDLKSVWKTTKENNDKTISFVDTETEEEQTETEQTENTENTVSHETETEQTEQTEQTEPNQTEPNQTEQTEQTENENTENNEKN